MGAQVNASNSPLGSVIIVDDDEHVRLTMDEMVIKSGYASVSFPDAASALEHLKTNHVEVVVTDIKMPDMDGLELTACIKQKYDIDVIVITGHADIHTYEEAVDKGASDFILKPVRMMELRARLQRVFRERKLRSEREALLKQLKKLAITDSLTKLYNRSHFYRQLKTEANRALRYGRVLSILFFDIDKFKKFNDTYGHLAGDTALKKTADAAIDCLRIADSTFRYGGEEFAVILPETDGSSAVIAAQRLKKYIEALDFEVESGEKAKLTVSVGVTELAPKEDVEECVKRSDQAMYVAKRAGGNQVHYIPPESQ